MDDQLVLLLAVFMGFSLGIALTWIASKGRIGAAEERGKSEVLIELATVREYARSLEQDRVNARTILETVTKQANEWRDVLNLLREDNSKHLERASRVPVLENEIEGLLKEQKIPTNPT
jgi:hypothetical protein